MYLKGSTSIKGRRYPLQIQGFYISVYDSKNNFIASDANTIYADLPADRYRLKASLCSNAGCYRDDEGYLDYGIYITTHPVTDEEKEQIQAQSDIPPVIHNHFKDMILNSHGAPDRILIDAVDENGDDLSLTAFSTHPMVDVDIDDNDIEMSDMLEALIEIIDF